MQLLPQFSSATEVAKLPQGQPKVRLNYQQNLTPFGCRSAAATPRFVSASYAKTAGFPPTPSRAAIVASDILEKTELDKINQYKLYRVNERCKKT